MRGGLAKMQKQKKETGKEEKKREKRETRERKRGKRERKREKKKKMQGSPCCLSVPTLLSIIVKMYNIMFIIACHECRVTIVIDQYQYQACYYHHQHCLYDALTHTHVRQHHGELACSPPCLCLFPFDSSSASSPGVCSTPLT